MSMSNWMRKLSKLINWHMSNNCRSSLTDAVRTYFSNRLNFEPDVELDEEIVETDQLDQVNVELYEVNVELYDVVRTLFSNRAKFHLDQVNVELYEVNVEPFDVVRTLFSNRFGPGKFRTI